MTTFSIPKGPMDLIIFDMPKTPRMIDKNKRTMVYFPDEDKVFIPVYVLNSQGFFKAAYDGKAPVFKIQGNNEMYIDSDYVIKEKLLDDEMIEALKKFKNRCLKGEFTGE